MVLTSAVPVGDILGLLGIGGRAVEAGTAAEDVVPDLPAYAGEKRVACSFAPTDLMLHWKAATMVPLWICRSRDQE